MQLPCGYPTLGLPTPAERAIRRRVARHGRITFAEYMARALYAPGGYYRRSNAGSDYYTSPQVHPAFGALLAVQLFHMWTLLDQPQPFTIIEPGAANGLLCRDIMAAADHLPFRFSDAIRYVACDLYPVAARESNPAEVHRASAHHIVADARHLPVASAGCVLSNELLDALPVHRLRMERGRLRELYVAVASDVADGYEGQLVEQSGEPSTPLLEKRLRQLGVSLADDQTVEICLLLDDWATSVAAAMERGFALTIDYGRSAADLYDPAQRPHGTLVTYREHRQTDSPLLYAGRQDITAQVDFTSVSAAGERAGLVTVGNVPQGPFLSRLGLQALRRNSPFAHQPAGDWVTLSPGADGLPPDTLPETLDLATDSSREWLTALTQLARPGGLGDFRVLVQAKGLPAGLADNALGWLRGAPTAHRYTPFELAGMIPPETLRLGPERFHFAAAPML